MSEHPYRGLPARNYWSRSVARDFDPRAVVNGGPLLRRGDRIASIGSCFASNLVPHIERAGYAYVRTEEPHPQLAHLPENLGYRDFSAAYGNVYTVRQMVQLVRRSVGLFTPAEDRWQADDAVVDPFRPGLAYPAVSDVEFDALTGSHLDATRRVFEQADVLIVTLGLTEAWESAVDGAVFPVSPGTVAGTFDPERHIFHNFTVEEVTADLFELVDAVHAINPSIRFILTVSPVPLVATASDHHVLEATVYSKSVLRVAAAHVDQAEPGVTYFPAYELVSGPQAPQDFFEADRRSVSAAAIATVMEAFLSASEDSPGGAVPQPMTAGPLAAVSAQVARAECEEELVDELSAKPS